MMLNIIRKIQVKTVSYHSYLLGCIQRMENNGETAEKLDPSCIVGENVNDTATMAACQLNTVLPCDPTRLFLGYIPR